jgi:hypothetical protein
VTIRALAPNLAVTLVALSLGGVLAWHIVVESFVQASP